MHAGGGAGAGQVQGHRVVPGLFGQEPHLC